MINTNTNTDTAIVPVTSNSVPTQLLSTTPTDPVATTPNLNTNTNTVGIESVSTMPPVPNKLEAVRNQLESKGLNNFHSVKWNELYKIKDHILYSSDFCNPQHKIEQGKCPILTSQIPEIHKIVSHDYKAEYKPLIKVLFEQELGKFQEEELQDGAVIMHTLIKIEKICGSEIESVLTALTAILNCELSVKEQPGDIAEACQLISQHCKNVTNPVDLIKLLYDDPNLDLKPPFASIAVDDESEEPYGWFASIKNAFFHQIEFVQETIWGKKKVHRSSDDRIEEKHTEAAENEHDDHSKSYFEPIKNIFAWIPYFGSFFSTRNDIKNEIKHDTLKITNTSVCDNDEGYDSANNGIKSIDTTPVQVDITVVGNIEVSAPEE